MDRLAGIHGEALYTAPDCAARAALQAANCQCKISLGGLKGGYSLLKESIPLLSVQCHRHCYSPSTRSVKSLLLSAKIRKPPLAAASLFDRPARFDELLAHLLCAVINKYLDQYTLADLLREDGDYDYVI